MVLYGHVNTGDQEIAGNVAHTHYAQRCIMTTTTTNQDIPTKMFIHRTTSDANLQRALGKGGNATALNLHDSTETGNVFNTQQRTLTTFPAYNKQ
eukprot:5573701-Alexandrium_andersonii.AAC.1